MAERRRFSRIMYQVPAVVKQGQYVLHTTIQDLSLHGLLLRTDSMHTLRNNDTVLVDFTLSDSDIDISLEADVVGFDQQTIRLKITHIDIDSISHLKRLVELNVGDDALLHREIEHLSDLGDEAS
ncbi:TPA: PilZ domain-containing protein [Vibrio vulnificus]|nr:PilZ domain-containing protein [Vibrio vulnificus]HAS6421249.1 PilZ domain-containing protein [Vibrio vulnificus]HBH7892190.1 PilZ domain-containing protein [Vibrio vulnificus]HDY8157303.1 PilZ domain-containing protein [Vibrio vulnificus]